jgi:hypothetical protein
MERAELIDHLRSLLDMLAQSDDDVLNLDEGDLRIKALSEAIRLLDDKAYG